MHKNTYANVTTLSAIAISAILLTSFTMVGMQFSQHASAQQMSSPPSANSSSAAPPSANSSSAAAPSANSSSASTNATAEPTSGQSFVWQGTAASQPDPLSGHEKEYVAAILMPRSDNGVYSGVLTYSASRGANVEIWHAFNLGNKTAIPKSFGVMKIATFNNKPIALTDISPSGSAGSVPFSGNAVLLHASKPFTVTYTVNAVAQPTKTVNSIQSLAAAQSTTSSSNSTSSGPSSSKSTSSGPSSSSSTSGGMSSMSGTHKHGKSGSSSSGGSSSSSGY